MPLHIVVFGVAQPKGNHRAINMRGMKFPVITESNRNVKSWQQLIAHAASDALQQQPASERGLLTGGVRVSVAFFLPRPKKYSKRGVYVEHLTAPDIDKLLRSVLDALSAVVWHDDKQVVIATATKQYAGVDEAPRADIWITSAAAAIAERQTAPLFEAAGA